MAPLNSITVEKLSRLIGRADSPVIIDVRTQEDFQADPRFIPTALRRSQDDVADWACAFSGASVLVCCQKGLKLGQGVAAWLRHCGASAEALEGGFETWRDAGLPLVPETALPKRDARGRTLWVTRSRPKIDRIACPWLIRRFVDAQAVVLFVNPADVPGVAEKFGAAAFDIEGVHWSHRGELCTFDVMVQEFGLSGEPIDHLARIVRAADTARLDLEPEAAGLLAVSLGLSRMFSDDLKQLEAGMLVYDAFYRWCCVATNETHNWPSPRTAAR